MDSSSLSLAFSIDHVDTFGTLETVLAIARRIGLELTAMSFDISCLGPSAALSLRTDDADKLDLFTLRLGNVIGVCDIDTVSMCRQFLQQ